MLELGDDDLIARTDVVREAIIGKRVRHQIQRFGRILGEDDLIRVDTDESADIGTRALVRVGGLLGQLVRATVHG